MEFVVGAISIFHIQLSVAATVDKEFKIPPVAVVVQVSKSHTVPLNGCQLDILVLKTEVVAASPADAGSIEKILIKRKTEINEAKSFFI